MRSAPRPAGLSALVRHSSPTGTAPERRATAQPHGGGVREGSGPRTRRAVVGPGMNRLGSRPGATATILAGHRQHAGIEVGLKTQVVGVLVGNLALGGRESHGKAKLLHTAFLKGGELRANLAIAVLGHRGLFF